MSAAQGLSDAERLRRLEENQATQTRVLARVDGNVSTVKRHVFSMHVQTVAQTILGARSVVPFGVSLGAVVIAFAAYAGIVELRTRLEGLELHQTGSVARGDK